MVEANTASGKARRISAATKQSERIRMFSTALRFFRYDDRLRSLERYKDHEDFFVRWHIAREIVSIRGKDALKWLFWLRDEDESSHIRRAASKTIEVLENSAELA